MSLKYKLFISTAALSLFLDQLTKTAARELIAPARRVVIIPEILTLRYAENTGMAFGLLQEFPESLRLPFFMLITVAALAIIIHLFRQTPARAVRLPLALGFIFAGASGNLIDRFRWGAVVDFIRVQVWPPAHYYWPTFNLADSFITIGIILLLADTLFAKEPETGERMELEGELHKKSEDQNNDSSPVAENASLNGLSSGSGISADDGRREEAG